MSKKSTPQFPSPDNPIVVPSKISLVAEFKILDEIISANAIGDVNKAIELALVAIDSTMDRQGKESVVGVAHQLAVKKDVFPRSLLELLRKAVAKGFLEHAYNAANMTMQYAKTIADYKEAERYFKAAMAYDKHPEIQAAAHVNYCPIVRDGLISGKEDWPAAVEIYETAARMGLLKGMYNAGNVSMWLHGKGRAGYGERAMRWFEYALDYCAQGKPLLDIDDEEELEDVLENARVFLSSFHINGGLPGTDKEVGLEYAKGPASRGNRHAMHNMGVAYMKRLAELTTLPHKSPGRNWQTVLSTMEWQFNETFQTQTLMLTDDDNQADHATFDRMEVKLADGSVIPLFVTHDACLPMHDGFGRMIDIANFLIPIFDGPFFILNRKAIFVDQKGRSYTPIYVWDGKKFKRQALWMGSSPDMILEHAAKNIDFLDEKYGTWTCMIPIAVNALDEGFVVAKNTIFEQTYATVGDGWKMPYVKKENVERIVFP